MNSLLTLLNGLCGAAILVALDKATGKDIWHTPNPGQHLMSHTSVMPAVLGGVRQYLYGTLKGPLGVSAKELAAPAESCYAVAHDEGRRLQQSYSHAAPPL